MSLARHARRQQTSAPHIPSSFHNLPPPGRTRVQSFSAIVGPNGSGKSNVIDALLFVFGKRASQIRLKKLAELIHNSTDFPNLKSCRVAVYFHLIRDVSDDDYEVLPASEFCISRTADKQSKSQYYINGGFNSARSGPRRSAVYQRPPRHHVIGVGPVVHAWSPPCLRLFRRPLLRPGKFVHRGAEAVVVTRRGPGEQSVPHPPGRGRTDRWVVGLLGVVF